MMTIQLVEEERTLIHSLQCEDKQTLIEEYIQEWSDAPETADNEPHTLSGLTVNRMTVLATMRNSRTSP